MKVINIADGNKRNSRVNMTPKKRQALSFYVDDDGNAVASQRVIRSTLETDLKTLTQDCSLEDLSHKLIEGDPEIDVEHFGKKVGSTSRLFLTEDNQPAAGVIRKEKIFNAEGELQEERIAKFIEANINAELPLMWSGKLLPKRECCKKYVFVNAFQLQHVDGLTFEFLYSMAKELEEKQALLFVGAGKKSNEPLVLSRNGKQYRAFIEGRTQGNTYQLILHLTNLELKAMPDANQEKQ